MLDKELQDRFGFIDNETICSDCGFIIPRDNAWWGMGKWWHNSKITCEKNKKPKQTYNLSVIAAVRALEKLTKDMRVLEETNNIAFGINEFLEPIKAAEQSLSDPYIQAMLKGNKNE